VAVLGLPDPRWWFRAGTPIPAAIAALDKPFPILVSFLHVKAVPIMPDARLGTALAGYLT